LWVGGRVPVNAGVVVFLCVLSVCVWGEEGGHNRNSIWYDVFFLINFLLSCCTCVSSPKLFQYILLVTRKWREPIASYACASLPVGPLQNCCTRSLASWLLYSVRKTVFRHNSYLSLQRPNRRLSHSHDAPLLGLARIVYIHRIWPYFWWFPCQNHRIYTVYILFWPTVLTFRHNDSLLFAMTHCWLQCLTISAMTHCYLQWLTAGYNASLFVAMTH
jgi:hypothetical protein